VPRFAGVNIPQEKRIEIALTYIFGIGKTIANKILKQAKVSPDIKTKDLSEEDFEKIRQIIDKNFKVEGALRSEVVLNIKRLKEINSWKGMRHASNLPVHGQKTRSNARAKRGRKITMATSRRVATEKT